MNVADYFKDNSKIYYGHGTASNKGGLNKTVLNIFESGLMCSCGLCQTYGKSPTIHSTTLSLGEGSDDLYDKRAHQLNNWKHRDSKNIIIASLPKNLLLTYHIISSLSARWNGTAAFCYSIPQGNGQQSFYLMPEFIKGCYDATNQKFIPNYNYYENLEKEQQEALFEQVKQNYKDTLLECASHRDFKFSSFAECQVDISEKLGEGWVPPFTEEETSEIDYQLKNISHAISNGTCADVSQNNESSNNLIDLDASALVDIADVGQHFDT